MNKTLRLFPLFLLLFSNAINANNPEAEDWYKKACTPDTGYDWHTGGRSWDFTYGGLCKRAKKNGKWKKADEAIIKILKIVRPRIKELSKKYNVSPGAVIGILLAENAMNQDILDDLEDWATSWKLAEDGKLLGKEFSSGWAQIRPSAARVAEKFLAAKENRKERSDVELTQFRKNPAGSIELTVAIIADAQDKYKNCICDQAKNPDKKCGYDISKDDAILATLFNIGSPGKFCKESLRNNRLPRPNYFGIWTMSARDITAEILGPPDQKINFSFEVDSNQISQFERELSLGKMIKNTDVNPYFDIARKGREFSEKWKDFEEITMLDMAMDPELKSKPLFEILLENPRLAKEKKQEETRQFIDHFHLGVQADKEAQVITKQAFEITSEASSNALVVISEFELNSVPKNCLNPKRDLDKLTSIKVKREEKVLSITDKRVCKNDIFYLVVTSSGKQGWINGGILSSLTTPIKLATSPKCKYDYDTSCKEVLEFETRVDIEQNLTEGYMSFAIPEVGGGDYQTDSCKFYAEHPYFQNDQQKALGILSTCANLENSLDNKIQTKLNKINNIITGLEYLDFSEISLELTSLGSICEVQEMAMSDGGLTDIEINEIMCKQNENSLYVAKEVLELQKKLAIITSFSNNENDSQELLESNVDKLFSVLEGISARKEFPKCASLWRDKTRKFLEKVKNIECVKGIEVPNLDIGADYFDSRKFSYTPSDTLTIKLRTSEMSCE